MNLKSLGAFSLFHPDCAEPVSSFFSGTIHILSDTTKPHLRLYILRLAVLDLRRNDSTATGGPQLCYPSEEILRGKRLQWSHPAHYRHLLYVCRKNMVSTGQLSLGPQLSLTCDHIYCAAGQECLVLRHILIAQHSVGPKQISVKWLCTYLALSSHYLRFLFILQAFISPLQLDFKLSVANGKIVCRTGFRFPRLLLDSFPTVPFLWEY